MIELCVMAGQALRTRVGRISLAPDGSAPTSPEELSAQADPSVVEATAAELDPGSLQAIVYASTSTAYVLGHRHERELVARLARSRGAQTGAASIRAAAACNRNGLSELRDGCAQSRSSRFLTARMAVTARGKPM